MSFRNRRRQKGAALVEYGLLVAGVALVATAAVSIFGTKTSGLIASIASVLPGAQGKDNAPITSGELIETTDADANDPAGNPIEVDVQAIVDHTGDFRLGDNLGLDIESLVINNQYDQ